MPMMQPTLLLLSGDEQIAKLVTTIANAAWRVAQHLETHATHPIFAEPNVKLVILDDEAIEGPERGRLLTQIRRRMPSASLLYIAAGHDEQNEKRARTNGAHYYVSKPLSLDRFGLVLQSFMRLHEAGVS
jgi:DNA-binding response OmpR family regulator